MESRETEELMSDPRPEGHIQSKAERFSLIGMIVMFFLFAVATGLAVFFYLDSDDCPLESCEGLVAEAECEDIVDCQELSETDQPDTECPKCEYEITAKKIRTLAEPIDIRDEDGRYFLKYEVCNEWSPGGLGIVSVCNEKEEVEYELSLDSENWINYCDAGAGFKYVDTDELIADPFLFEGYKCLGEGAQGNELFVINDKVIVRLENAN